MPEDRLQLVLREASRIAAAIALYCDRSEHNEPTTRDGLRDAAEALRFLAASVSQSIGADLVHLYAARLDQVERLSAAEPNLPSPSAEARRAKTWRDLQVAQLRHDRHYHADVFGLSRRDQLIHMALHVSKLAGAVALLFDAEPAQWVDFERRRLPDMLLFGIKLSTVTGEKLSDEAVQFRTLTAGSLA